MFEFHTDKVRYFDWQYQIARDYILPYIQAHLPAGEWNVLEIGCGEAGVLKAFLEAGHQCTGIDLDAQRIELAHSFHEEAVASGQLRLLSKNIYDIDVAADLGQRFDVIILKDVIEHIPNQGHFLACLHDFIAPDGVVFFGFPPWQMPFGGHQQICRNSFLARLPYYHLLPRSAYRAILEALDEPEPVVRELLELKDTGLSIEAFERLLRQSDWQVLHQQTWLINPIYQFKFKLRPRQQFAWIDGLPGLRNLLTTCAYYLVKKRERVKR